MSIRALFLLLFVTLIVLLGVVFHLMNQVVENHRDSAAAEVRRHESYKLADELRQSSDDLTRMARTYVVTGDPAYENYFQRILDIRNGLAPRPDDYADIYWDFVTASGETPAAAGESVPLIELMVRTGFTEGELALLQEAQDRSDALVGLEERAMAAIKGLYPDDAGRYTVPGEPDPELARALMHGPEYHAAKARIMEPVQRFLKSVEQRTAGEVAGLRTEGQVLVRDAIVVMAIAAGLLLLGYWLIRRRVVTPVQRLAVAAGKVERGDYGDRIGAVGRDELAQLSNAFDQMSAAIERDVEQRRRTADELEQAREDADAANRAKSAFLANMSHELRTPMNAIIGYSEMMLEEFDDDEELQEYAADVRKVHSAGHHLLSLINDILDLSKIEAGQMDLYLERFDLGEMLAEAAATVEPLVKKNGNTLRLDVADDAGAIRADLTKVRQALFNLLSNAAKFTHDGTITLAVRRVAGDGGERVLLQVSDTGIGIPEDKLEHVFEEFSQADSSTTRNYGGTGLGLPISKRFCQMMGGDITVASRPGEGSTFTIDLPAKVDAMAAAKAVTGAASGPQSEAVLPPDAVPDADEGAGDIVLVIDDDDNVRELLARRFRSEGYRVAQAPDGPEGLALARELQPVAITLDIMMPSMDGWSVLRELKADPVLQDIPVVVVTVAGDRELGYTLGAADFLTKPVDRDRLLATMRRHCRGEARILVVEDDEPTRTVMTRTLTGAGFRVDEAGHGAEGLERIDAQRPDLVLLDLMMPVMDGFEFLRRIRAREDTADLPVLILTARELSADERRFLATEADSVLAKHATDLNEVVAEVRAAVTPVGQGEDDSPGA